MVIESPDDLIQCSKGNNSEKDATKEPIQASHDSGSQQPVTFLNKDRVTNARSEKLKSPNSTNDVLESGEYSETGQTSGLRNRDSKAVDLPNEVSTGLDTLLVRLGDRSRSNEVADRSEEKDTHDESAKKSSVHPSDGNGDGSSEECDVNGNVSESSASITMPPYVKLQPLIGTFWMNVIDSDSGPPVDSHKSVTEEYDELGNRSEEEVDASDDESAIKIFDSSVHLNSEVVDVSGDGRSDAVLRSYGNVRFGTRDDLEGFVSRWGLYCEKYRREGFPNMSNHPVEGIILDEYREHMQRLTINEFNYREGVNLKLLGRGVSGSCYAIIDNTKEQSICVKQIHLSKFEANEVLVPISLNDTRIVKLYGVMITDGYVYIFQELIKGPTLADYISKVGPLIPKYADYLLMQLCGILIYLKSKGVVHGDINTGNVMLRMESVLGKLVLIDFGCAKTVTTSEDHDQDKECLVYFFLKLNGLPSKIQYKTFSELSAEYTSSCSDSSEEREQLLAEPDSSESQSSAMKMRSVESLPRAVAAQRPVSSQTSAQVTVEAVEFDERSLMMRNVPVEK